MDANVDLHVKIELILRLCVHLDVIIDRHPLEFVLDEASAVDLIDSCHAMLLVWQDVREGQKRLLSDSFHFATKSHWLLHACYLARFVPTSKANFHIYQPNILPCRASRVMKSLDL